MIQDMVTLDADPELFLEKMLDDIFFIDQTLRTLLGSLENNHHLIERDELFEQLSGAEAQFASVLQNLINHEGAFSVMEIPSLAEKLKVFRSGSLERQKIAGKLQPVEKSPAASLYVSSDELTELLKAFQD